MDAVMVNLLDSGEGQLGVQNPQVRGRMPAVRRWNQLVKLGYGNDSRQGGPFGDFADRPARRASRCVFHFQSLGYYERWSKLLLCTRSAQKSRFITRST